MAERRLQLSRTAPLVAVLALCAGCAALPQSGPLDEPVEDDIPVTGSERRQEVMRPASAALIEQSRAQSRAGQTAQAAATLERALRIDPNEPAVWLELARVAYADQDWRGAEQYARRARSLAGADSAMAEAAVGVIADALVMQGRPAEAERLRDEG